MEGGSLAQRLLGNEPFALRPRLVVAVQAAEGLAYLHLEVQRVHCDLKPDNILLDAHGNARIGDFGLARSLPESRLGTRTSGVAKGTFGYMAPEYITSGKVTAAIDVVSFGVVLLELLSGQVSPSPAGPIYDRHDELIAAWQDGEEPERAAFEALVPASLRHENHAICRDLGRLAAQCVHLARFRPLIKADAADRSVLDRLRGLLALMPPAKSSCAICLVNPPVVVMVPCGHQCLCPACSPLVVDTRCPMCQQPVNQRVVARPS